MDACKNESYTQISNQKHKSKWTPPSEDRSWAHILTYLTFHISLINTEGGALMHPPGSRPTSFMGQPCKRWYPDRKEFHSGRADGNGEHVGHNPRCEGLTGPPRIQTRVAHHGRWECFGLWPEVDSFWVSYEGLSWEGHGPWVRLRDGGQPS